MKKNILAFWGEYNTNQIVLNYSMFLFKFLLNLQVLIPQNTAKSSLNHSNLLKNTNYMLLKSQCVI